jgi:signal transduction histidine kinase
VAPTLSDKQFAAKNRFAIRSLTAAVALTGMLLVWFAYNSYHVYHITSTSMKLKNRMTELQWTIIRLDEILTMSARMAVATGDQKWEERYRFFYPPFAEAIKEIVALAPASYSKKTVTEIEEADRKSKAMEAQAFSWVHQNDLNRARGILYNGEYETQKGIYSHGMEQLRTQLEKTTDANLQSAEKKVFNHTVVVLISIPFLLTGWMTILRTMKLSQKMLVGANLELARRTEELTVLNASLDKRIAERTKDLELSRIDAVNMMEKAVEAKTKAEQINKELKETQATLLQSEKMASLGKLAAGVAHEINNPMAFVNSNLRALKEYMEDTLQLLEGYERVLTAVERGDAGETTAQTKKVRALSEQIDFGFVQKDFDRLMTQSLEGVERVRQIVQNLREFSHVDQADQKWFNINRGIESTLDIVWNELKYKAEVIKELGEIPEILCYPQQLNQVFMNLLVNAAQAMDRQAESSVGKGEASGSARTEGAASHFPAEQRGKIWIRSFERDNQVVVEVEDTGCGIAPENFRKVFEPFYTTKPVGKGTGLGLSISYGIVQKHGGRIELESIVGKGTTFRILLPIAKR